MITGSRPLLNDWFRSHTARPMVIGNSLTAIILFLFSSFLFLQDRALTDNAISDLEQVLPRAIAQQNRPMLETLLLTFSERVRARSVGICEDKREILSLKERLSLCSERESALPFLYQLRRFEISGSKHQSVYLVVPRFARLRELCMIAVAAIMMALINTAIAQRILRGLRLDLVSPLRGGHVEDVKIAEVYELLTIRDEANALKRKVAISDAKREMALQVAHDIRSPLSALRILTNKMRGPSLDYRELLDGVVQRIESIANDLLQENRCSEGFIDIAQAAREVVDEKALEYTQDINLRGDKNGLIAQGDQNKFKRILSNLINNSIQARSQVINLTCDRNGELVLLTLSDDGEGIPKDILIQLGQRKVSTSVNGNGIGLSSAFALVRSWDGDIDITSRLNRGTEVKLSLRAVRQS